MPPDATFLLLDELIARLAAEGFQPGLEAHIRLRRWVARLAERGEAVPVDRLKYHLGALLALSEEGQEQFYRIFGQWIAPYWQAAPIDTGPAPVEKDDFKPSEISPPPFEAPLPAPPDPLPPVPKQRATPVGGRSGPIRIELQFPNDGFRPWNTPELDQSLRPLREKEWTAVREWDVPASIRRTIRAGGIPQFVPRFRKKAPQYLLLIDQKSPRDHLAGLYADLAVELQRRDLDAEYYFYETLPFRCWRDPRDPRTHTNIETLHSQWPDARLLLVGEVDALLDLPDLRPSNLAFDLLDQWRNVALLTPKSTADWGEAERVLCAMLPIVPAHAAGLSTLLRQWNATELYTPFYWQTAHPEPPLADVPPVLAADEAPDDLVENLYYYLGEQGFQWLCAAAVYPELYWELTKLLHDESIPPDRALNEGDQNRRWQIALLRLSRVRWFRQGALPPKMRGFLWQYAKENLPVTQLDAIRAQLLSVLKLNESRFPPGSYADANRAFTVAWYEYERALAAPHLSDAERARIEAEFREKGLAKIQLSEIEDAVGRQLFAEVKERSVWPPAPEGEGFHVLWVDDHYENNKGFEEVLLELWNVQTIHVRSTEEALEKLAERGFDLVISDVGRRPNRRAGVDMMQVFNERRVTTPVVFYTVPDKVDAFGEELKALGALAVVTGREALEMLVSEQVEAQKRNRQYDVVESNQEFIISLLKEGQLKQALEHLILSNEGNAESWIKEYNLADHQLNLGTINHDEYRKIHGRILVAIFENWLNRLPTKQSYSPKNTRFESPITDNLVSTLEETSKGFLFYFVPAQMQLSQKSRCLVRISTNLELLLQGLLPNLDDMQLEINLSGIREVEVELVEVAQNESSESAFTIDSDRKKPLRFHPERYLQWNFEVEPEESGSFELELRITIKEETGTLRTISFLKTVEVHLGNQQVQNTPRIKERIDHSRLPVVQYLVGREQELALLDAAWRNPRVNLIEIIAPGGTGKTSLVTWWLRHRLPELLEQPEATFAFSFYEQDQQVSADHFFMSAADFFDLDAVPMDNPEARASMLLLAFRERRCLLILDGVESVLQEPDSFDGLLKNPALVYFLKELATSQPGLCICTSRLAIAEISDIAEPEHQIYRVENLSDAAAIELLRQLGVHGTEEDLIEAVHDYEGHSLSLRLLAHYLVENFKGDVQKRSLIPLPNYLNSEQDNTSIISQSPLTGSFEPFADFTKKEVIERLNAWADRLPALKERISNSDLQEVYTGLADIRDNMPKGLTRKQLLDLEANIEQLLDAFALLSRQFYQVYQKGSYSNFNVDLRDACQLLRFTAGKIEE